MNLKSSKNISQSELTAPGADEIEISIFGPGYGESILVHIGYGHWIVVDSCIDKISRKPAVLRYLNAIEVDPKTAVKLVIASHWHDDHIRGLSEIIDVCESADFACSGAMNSDDFYMLMQTYTKNPKMKAGTGVDEFTRIMESLARQNKRAQPVFQNEKLWYELFDDGKGYSHECEIHSLSPSKEALVAALADFKAPEKGTSKKRALATSPNMSSVVLWISVAGFNILLGADLEESDQKGRGWSAIVDSKTKPKGTAAFLKIPHHGSKNAHHPDVWEKMLDTDPIAVLTPWQNRLPTDRDIERLCSLSSDVYSTARTWDSSKIKRDPTVEKTIAGTVNKITCNTSSGQVRLRVSGTDKPKIDLFGDAYQLSND